MRILSFGMMITIFSDIGIKPPLLLLGTEEANRIANEEQQRRYIEKMDEHFGEG